MTHLHSHALPSLYKRSRDGKEGGMRGGEGKKGERERGRERGRERERERLKVKRGEMGEGMAPDMSSGWWQGQVVDPPHLWVPHASTPGVGCQAGASADVQAPAQRR
jgi:hypothetical protein